MSTNQKPTEIITGVVRAAFDEDEPKPGKIRIENQTGEQDIAVWPDRDTGEMPNYWLKLQANGLESIIGQTIKARCIKGTVYNDRQQWNATLIEAVGEASSADTSLTEHQSSAKTIVKPQPVQQASVGVVAQIDPNQMRIMRQSTLHYAAIIIASKEIRLTEVVQKTIDLAGKFLEYVITGDMPLFEEGEQAKPEPAKTPKEYEGDSGVLDVLE